MVAPSSVKFKRELSPPLLNQNHLHPLLGFLTGFAAHLGFRGSLSTVVVVVFPPLRPASDAFVRSLAKCPELEFLELGMILYLLVMISASQVPA